MPCHQLSKLGLKICCVKKAKREKWRFERRLQKILEGTWARQQVHLPSPLQRATEKAFPPCPVSPLLEIQFIQR